MDKIKEEKMNCKSRKAKVSLIQMRLVTAITFEIARQYPGITVEQDQFKVIIAAANRVKAVYEGTEVTLNTVEEE
ncbi:hypothetical protein O3W44_22600 [Pantoea sp. LMR881]|uniref:hypothetical protein n=1 Tax=Pantoea sp. LMR881 TaxID=3014336 RepID=UPI0022AEDDB4|nr:hypothetical protein [Pantoea sp. LMR881]MCZ4061325.1 hypothetical protein [Pantoea sp. LMR881]